MNNFDKSLFFIGIIIILIGIYITVTKKDSKFSDPIIASRTYNTGPYIILFGIVCFLMPFTLKN
jgi:hypothetical protein